MVRLYVVAGRDGAQWRRALQLREEKATIFWCTEGGAAARRLTAILSEGGVVARWLPLSGRPQWLEAALHQPWPNTQLAQFLVETPFLVVEAPEAAIQALRVRLVQQQLLQETLFLPAYLRSPLTTAPIVIESPRQIEAWQDTYEELRGDLAIAARWLPCTLTAQIL